jgi:hypothetical protein
MLDVDMVVVDVCLVMELLDTKVSNRGLRGH